MKNILLHKEINKLKKIRLNYPHPLSGTTKFQRKDEKILSLNFFPYAQKRKYVKEKDLKLFLEKINKDLNKLEHIKISLRDEKAPTSYKNFYKKKINETIEGLLLLKSASFIEAEKGGINSSFIINSNFLINEIDYLSTLLYGPPIKEKKDEIKKIKNYLNDLYIDNKESLSSKEQIEFKKIFKKLFHDEVSKEKLTNKKTKHRYCPIFEKKIDVKTLKEIFEKIFEIYGIKEPIQIVKDKTYIDFGENGNYLPEGTNYTIERVLKLISHEIETHTIRRVNNPFGIGTQKNIIREEGLAIFNEEMTFSNKPEKQISSLNSFVTIYASEIFDYKKLKKFLILYKKLLKENFDEKNIQKILTRRKRYHSRNLPGANRKDIVYYRGYEKITKTLKKTKNKKNFYKLFEGKIGIKDFQLIDKMFDEKIRKENMIYPIRIGKILFYKLTRNKSNIDELKRKDFRFKYIETIPNAVKEKINEIYQIIKNKSFN